ncbi:MAG: hypothetical protein ABR497_01015 [Kiritimatiellia bacterium]|nr:hypothetical protein [Lentisphaerota bacterium]
MGSGRAMDELSYSAKKPREQRRREREQRKRLLALGVPEAKLSKMTSLDVRLMLKRPVKVKQQFAAQPV